MVTDVIADVWRFRRRPLLIVAGMLVGLIVLMLALAAVMHGTTRARNAAPTSATAAGATAPEAAAPPSAAPASDVASWDAIPAVAPATTTAYPPISAAARQDPSTYAAAFVQELFNRDYRIDRQQLLAWVQSEDSPLQASNYPRADWSKFLLDSLTDLTWDEAIDTPIPADGPWLALGASGSTDTVSDVKVSLDTVWEQKIASGYQPPDQLATARDTTFTVTRHDPRDEATTRRYSVSLVVQLGTRVDGGYGVAATNNYVVKEVS
jgi:hypothetical protein